MINSGVLVVDVDLGVKCRDGGHVTVSAKREGITMADVGPTRVSSKVNS